MFTIVRRSDLEKTTSDIE